jgi:hypothetical protein
MELKNNKEINDGLQYSEKLRTLDSQLPAILKDFNKYYVFYNKNPEYPEYQQMFENIKGNLTKISSDLFVLSNDVQSNTDKLNEKLFYLDSLIKQEKDKNRKLKLKLGIVEHKNNASYELISNYKDMYDSGYLRNWGLFFSIIIAGITISKVY